MLKYIGRRILVLIPTLLAVVFIVLFIMNLTPGDPGTLILGEQASREEIEAKNEELGFNDPFPVRYVNYVVDLCQGDLGNSWKTGRPVMGELLSRLPVTATLAIGSILIGSIVGILFGILSAVKQYSFLDFAGTTIAMALASFPGFWIGMMLILFFSLYLRWLPSFGAGDLKHFILPWITAACPLMASQLRMTRTSMLEVIRADYIRTARAKGQKESKVIIQHALRNALLPVITIMGINFGASLGGTVTIETVFTLPGVGSLIIEAIRMKDVPLVTGATVMLATFFALIMLVVDVMYAYIDPRIKSRYTRK
ncbi:MAG: ABC transporter permease [Lachnospiraceae bacterium]|nr:ABC transporter permease [Lachnospiraceae bacterium]